MRCCARNAKAESQGPAASRQNGHHKAPGKAPKSGATNGSSMESSKKNLCEIHRSDGRRRRVLAASLLGAAVVAAVIALALFLVYRPMKPQATVARAGVYHLVSATTNGTNNSAATPYALSATVQFTLLLHNPSDRTAVVYDRLLAYVTYRGEMVAPPAQLPLVLQDPGADVAVSPLLGGDGGAPVPVSADAVDALHADCVAGRVQLRLVVMGRVRYRSGPFKSAWRDLYVRCDAILGLTVQAAAGGGGAGDVPLLEYPKCAVDA
ncbi:NDR1/HIN1-like protein 26 [Aegilops tauschii subsp. strangulata]|uniref:Late embryogenesis abundant protein LEA-2 subgroup domain-containing protein n=3 Tax=Triticinae TaxID=1648030 RepID=A0A453LER9_AEGTS|nr:NDR1/HIN1-like protein 12 [Aegilops tauschii subsp. strangulata]